MRQSLTSIRPSFLAFLLCFIHVMSLPLSAQKGGNFAEEASEGNYLEGTIILRIDEKYRDLCRKNDIAVTEIQAAFSQLGVKDSRRIFPNHTPPAQTKSKIGNLADLSLIYRVNFDPIHAVPDAIQMLKELGAIAYVEPAYIYELFYQPNDPLADTSEITVRNRAQWGLVQIKAYEAWDIQRGDSSIVIGVVDSGHNGGHEDMQDNLFINRNEIQDGLDNDGDGYVDNIAGWDFAGNTIGGLGDNDPNVGNVHGFAVAGILGASTDNGIGIAGSGFNCRYIPIKAAPDDSLTAIFFGYEGIVYAVDQGAQIVNCSWGGPSYSHFGADVVQYATVNKGAALVVAAGNSRSDTRFYPAAYNLCLSVANSFYDDVLFPNSTYNYTIDIAAPGGSILTTNGSGYASFGGTSAAAPLAAGALGIVVNHFPQLTGFQAAQRMRITSDEINTINDSSIYEDRLGKGRINLFRALNDPLMPSIRHEAFQVIDLDGDGRFLGGDTLLIAVDFVNYLHTAQNLDIDLTLPDALLPYARILRGNIAKGSVNMWERFTSGENMQIILDASIPDNFALALKLTYTDNASSYDDFEYLEFVANKSWIDIQENNLQTSVNNVGNFGFNALGKTDEGLGVLYGGGESALFEGGFLIGNSTTSVSDRIRNNLASSDQDFTSLERISQIANPALSDFEVKSKFSDATAISPLGIHITQHSFAYTDTANDDFVIFQYIINNPSTTDINGLYAGLFADWDIIAANKNRNGAYFDLNRNMVYAKDEQGINSNHYGMALLTNQGFKAYASVLPSSQLSFTTASKFIALSNTPDAATATAGTQNGGKDIAQFVSTGPFSISPNEQDTVAFAIVGGGNLQELEQHQAAALETYKCRVLDQGPNEDFLSTTVNHKRDYLFSDQNTTASSWSWDFGDGSGDIIQNPLHSYDTAGIYLVTLTVTEGTCTRIFTQEIEVESSVSVDPEIELPILELFPNPAKGAFSISLEGNWSGQLQVQLYAQDGKQVWMESIEGAGSYERLVNRKAWAKGIYILRIQHADFQLTRKLMLE